MYKLNIKSLFILNLILIQAKIMNAADAKSPILTGGAANMNLVYQSLNTNLLNPNAYSLGNHLLLLADTLTNDDAKILLGLLRRFEDYLKKNSNINHGSREIVENFVKECDVSFTNANSAHEFLLNVSLYSINKNEKELSELFIIVNTAIASAVKADRGTDCCCCICGYITCEDRTLIKNYCCCGVKKDGSCCVVQ